MNRRIELGANLDVDVADLCFCGKAITPLGQRILQLFCREKEVANGAGNVAGRGTLCVDLDSRRHMSEDGNGTRREMQGQLGAVRHFIMSQGCKKFLTIDEDSP
jgi:hypothetical protein